MRLMPMKKTLILVILQLSFLAGGDGFAATIAFRNETNVVGPVVRLNDLAVISGEEPEEQLAALGAVPVCSAPPPSELLILNMNAIAYSLRASGVDLSGLRFEGPQQVLVRREYVLLSVEELQQVVTAYVSEQTGWEEDSFVANPPKNMQSIPIPLGSRRIVVETFPNEDFRGSVFVRFKLWIDGELYRELAHRFLIERYVDALVASHKIARGQRVEAADMEITKVEQSRVDDDSFAREEEAIGLVAVRTIYPGTALTSDILMLPPLVRRGQDASVILEGSGFNIMTRGRVLEDGCADQLVRVRLSSSRKIVKARVVDSKTLRMSKPGKFDEEF